MFVRIADDRGSFLVEIVVSAAMVVIVALGVLAVLDRSTTLSRQQDSVATATAVAQEVQENLRTRLRFGPGAIANLNTEATTSRVVKRVTTYTATSTADWISDTYGQDVDCVKNQGADAGPSYLRLKTTVDWTNRGSRAPVTVTSIMSYQATVDPGLGAFKVVVLDRNNAGLAGAPVALTGLRNATSYTGAGGCALFADLPIPNTTKTPPDASYTMKIARSGYVTPSGATSITDTALPAKTAPVAKTYVYDRAGSVAATFITDRPANADQAAATIRTAPGAMAVDNAQTPSPFSITLGAAASEGEITGLFPFTQAYSVHADTCALATPPGNDAVSATVSPGTRTDAKSPGGSYEGVRVPARNIKVTSGGAAIADAVIKVKTRCETTIERKTGAKGWINDPGFPYMPSDATNKRSGLVICASSPVSAPAPHRKLTVGSPSNLISNTNFAGTTTTMDLSTDPASTTGDC